ncbi:hypothetical protein [Kitasatospora sp. NPDC002040]|uniref:hypothetical protein n=1 Tax=Kitasatospora sp. NPDC002040 TaxID=3154661 RepID=UPI00331D2C1E
MEIAVTKRGSTIRKARVRALAAAQGQSYQQAARALRRDSAKVMKERTDAEKAAWRAWPLAPEILKDRRDYYLWQMLGSDLPEMVKVCLFGLSSRVGTTRLFDPSGVRCTMDELASDTGLDIEAACLAVHVAEANGWCAEGLGPARPVCWRAPATSPPAVPEPALRPHPAAVGVPP